MTFLSEWLKWLPRLVGLKFRRRGVWRGNGRLKYFAVEVGEKLADDFFAGGFGSHKCEDSLFSFCGWHAFQVGGDGGNENFFR